MISVAIVTAFRSLKYKDMFACRNCCPKPSLSRAPCFTYLFFFLCFSTQPWGHLQSFKLLRELVHPTSQRNRRKRTLFKIPNEAHSSHDHAFHSHSPHRITPCSPMFLAFIHSCPGFATSRTSGRSYFSYDRSDPQHVRSLYSLNFSIDI